MRIYFEKSFKTFFINKNGFNLIKYTCLIGNSNKRERDPLSLCLFKSFFVLPPVCACISASDKMEPANSNKEIASCVKAAVR